MPRSADLEHRLPVCRREKVSKIALMSRGDLSGDKAEIVLRILSTSEFFCGAWHLFDEYFKVGENLRVSTYSVSPSSDRLMCGSLRERVSA
jgi:hypothetical protein